MDQPAPCGQSSRLCDVETTVDEIVLPDGDDPVAAVRKPLNADLPGI
jgi:hypothetical protein